MAGLTNTDKALTFSYLMYLNDLRGSGKLSEDSAEGLEVAVDLLQNAFGVDIADKTQADLYKLEQPLEEVVRKQVEKQEVSKSAESYKLQGNVKLDSGDYAEAVELYTKAIEIDGNNATFFANRAAAHMYLQDYAKAKEDCKIAVEKNPGYAKAYHRLGRICAHLNEKEDAKEYYTKAIEIDPSNEKYKADLQSFESEGATSLSSDADSTSEQPGNPTGTSGPLGGFNLAGLLSNPSFMNMATSMMQNPAFQSTLSGLASNMTSTQPSAANSEASSDGGSGGLFSNLMPQMQEVAGQMRRSNPELFDQLRDHVQQTGQPNQVPPSSK
ncbi:small glutamine-rich tetratricopeptide repeat-containing protein alpha-like [Dysidea avara]|uniref:small glutamine-rich tetratricopeptide repeat-containing protein alpha-like n=1 Tax=Dysidea avara TaxID=196820 RepID=UPI00332DD62F